MAAGLFVTGLAAGELAAATAVGREVVLVPACQAVVAALAVELRSRGREGLAQVPGLGRAPAAAAAAVVAAVAPAQAVVAVAPAQAVVAVAVAPAQAVVAVAAAADLVVAGLVGQAWVAGQLVVQVQEELD